MNSKKSQNPATEAALAQAAEPLPEVVPAVTTPAGEPVSPVAAEVAASEVASPVKAKRRAVAKKPVAAQQPDGAATVAEAPVVVAVTAKKAGSSKPSKGAKTSKAVKASKTAKVVKAAPEGALEKAPKAADKPLKVKKTRLVRDSYAMPDNEYQRIAELKRRLAGLSAEYKKSELLRAGVALLAALNDAELLAVMAGVERIKTGRPRKK